jgi:predicted nucleic acid-binding protein
MTKTQIPVICDAGPIIHLQELRALDLLSSFENIMIPYSVSQEIAFHCKTILPPEFKIIPDYAPNETLHEIQRIFCLHKGEVAAIGLAIQNMPCIFLTDDSAARLAAQQFRIEVHGTIGILIRAVRKNQRSRQDIQDIVKGIKSKSSLHISNDLIEFALEKLAAIR